MIETIRNSNEYLHLPAKNKKGWGVCFDSRHKCIQLMLASVFWCLALLLFFFSLQCHFSFNAFCSVFYCILLSLYTIRDKRVCQEFFELLTIAAPELVGKSEYISNDKYPCRFYNEPKGIQVPKTVSICTLLKMETFCWTEECSSIFITCIICRWHNGRIRRNTNNIMSQRRMYVKYAADTVNTLSRRIVPFKVQCLGYGVAMCTY